MISTNTVWDALVGLEQLEVDTGPSAADFVVGDTVTGGTSGTTCVIVAVISSTNYIIKDRDGEFTDGEILTDDSTNSIDCAAGYPVITEENVIGLLAADTQLPTELRRKLTAISEHAKLSSLKLGKSDMSVVGDALEYACKGTRGYRGLTP
jgi:hypothetical protein